MNSIRTLIAVAAATVSLSALAQTANTPGGQAATGTPLDQTHASPSSTTPKTTATTPTATDPAGSLKGGKAPGTTVRNPSDPTHRSQPTEAGTSAPTGNAPK